MSDKMSKNEWIERCAARMLAQQATLESGPALDLAEQVWTDARGALDPEQAADMELRGRSTLTPA
ncbi:hypothetical protein OOT46_19045 [Aquabacterium sp. A7-Y]|uniref:hypothetical protein n=1 Tax=Aquabacterium sp. A7-Y TaxID=1349605 RepID=UPI00223CB23A|nr:hypothetical protein [Aquabacterium sp. A7-Y]MCW7539937.1 hypothetical protein [Aquabacterium sp. A7-Y]